MTIPSGMLEFPRVDEMGCSRAVAFALESSCRVALSPAPAADGGATRPGQVRHQPSGGRSTGNSDVPLRSDAKGLASRRCSPTALGDCEPRKTFNPCRPRERVCQIAGSRWGGTCAITLTQRNGTPAGPDELAPRWLPPPSATRPRAVELRDSSVKQPLRRGCPCECLSRSA